MAAVVLADNLHHCCPLLIGKKDAIATAAVVLADNLHYTAAALALLLKH